MTKKAFTLIEVMVVLSVLAIIAILGYNFFGSTMKEARVSADAAKVYQIYLSLDRCYWDYVETNDTYPSTNNTLSSCADSGYIREIPKTPSSAHTDGVSVNVKTFNINYGGPTASADRVLYSLPYTDDVCKEFNRKYTGLGATIPVANLTSEVGTALLANSPVCFLNGANNYIHMVMEWN